VLLAVATVATAWAAYRARQWTGEQSQGYSRATAARIESDRAAALANRQVQIDVATFVKWIDARAQDRTAAPTTTCSPSCSVPRRWRSPASP
jgi:hypothetical protein